MNYWLMKSEPADVSVDDAIAAPRSTVAWTGVRNYQARNYMRDNMRVGDGVLFYHSSCAEPGIVGIGKVASTPYPDPTQFDKKSKYYDPKSKKEVEAFIKRLREAVNYLCEYSIDRHYGLAFALEAKPNEPRGDIYRATTGAYLGLIPTLARPELVGVNSEVAH